MASSRKIIYPETASAVWSQLKTSLSQIYVLWLEVGENYGDFPDMLSAVEWIREYRNLLISASVRLPVFVVYSDLKEYVSDLTLDLGVSVIEKNTQESKKLKDLISDLPEINTPDSNWFDSYVFPNTHPHKDSIHLVFGDYPNQNV